MNWNPLRKASSVKRPELDASGQSAAEALERLVGEFELAEAATKSLYLSAKKLPDHILCTGKFETKLVDELRASELFAAGQMQRLIDEWGAFACSANSIGDQYVISVQKSLIEPLKQLRQAFAELRAAVRSHELLQLHVLKLQRKVATCADRDKTGPNLVKLQHAQRALSAGQREFAQNTAKLTNDLTKFIAASVDMLQPLLEGYIAAEVAWIRACKRALDGKAELDGALASAADHGKMIEDSFKIIADLSISNS